MANIRRYDPGMKILTPALGWFLFGAIIAFFGFVIMSSAEYNVDDSFLLGSLVTTIGFLAALVGVIAKGVEVGLAGGDSAKSEEASS